MSTHSTTDDTQPLEQHPMFDLGTEADLETGASHEAYAEPVTSHRRRRGRRTDEQPSRSSGTGLCFVGLTLVLGGLALAVLVTSKPEALGNLAAFLTTGVTPGTIVMVGFALLAAGLVVRASQSDDTQRLEEAIVRVEDSVERLANTTPAIEGDELHRALMLLQRQDEKINNLTRAIKMYGKPLVELGNASSDILGRLRDLQGELKGKDEPWKELEKPIAELSVRISELQGNQGREQLDKLVADQAELRDTLQRLEQRDPTQGLEEKLAGLAARVEQAASGPDYEESFRSLQRELQGLATTLGNIQANMGRSRAAPAAAPAPAPAVGSSSEASLAGDPEGKPGPGGLASSIAGTSQAKGGKNVLGAIAKLKSMRN